MDSASLAYWKRPDHALTIDYGQVAARAEIGAAASIAQALNIRHSTIRLDLSSLGSGDMAGSEPSALAPVPEWWPFRNQLVLTVAGMYAVRVRASEVLIGTVASDASHADGRPEFIEAMSAAMRLQEGALVVTAPALHMTAVDLAKRSGAPRELLAWAHSCHTSSVACGACRGCVKHFETWRDLGWDPH